MYELLMFIKTFRFENIFHVLDFSDFFTMINYHSVITWEGFPRRIYIRLLSDLCL